MKKRVLIICRNNLFKAPRFLMEIDALEREYSIIAAGNDGDRESLRYKFIKLNNVDSGRKISIVFHLGFPSLIRKIVSAILKIRYYRSLNEEKYLLQKDYKLLKNEVCDLVIVHHLKDLPLAVKLADRHKVKIIFNAHEYYPLEFEDVSEWMKNVHPLSVKIARKYFGRVSVCFCVGEEIAKKYKQEFGLRSEIITNSKQYHTLFPKKIEEGKPIKMVHHGGAIRSRKIELAIQMMEFLNEDFELHLILVPGDLAYINELKEMAGAFKNINFVDPVSTLEISSFINKYDIGLFLLPPTNFNYQYALPNKFFEFIQARLAIAIGPSPEMANIVRKHNLGVVSENFEPAALANKVRELTRDQIYFFKNQADLHARELSAEETEKKIKRVVDNLIIHN